MISGNAALRAGIEGRPGVAMFGGGLPIMIGGEVVGAIGVSGGAEEFDILYTSAALAAIGAQQY